MSTHNIGFYEEMMNIIFQLSSNMHLIGSSKKITFSVILQTLVLSTLHNNFSRSLKHKH